MAGNFVVINGGKLCGEKWRETLLHEMAGTLWYEMGNYGKWHPHPHSASR